MAVAVIFLPFSKKNTRSNPITNNSPAAMPSTRSVTCNRRADASVSSCRISVNSIAIAATSVKAHR